MSDKDMYRVTFTEHILEGTQDVVIHAGCVEEAETKLYKFMNEWIDKKDITIDKTERVEINEPETEKDSI